MRKEFIPDGEYDWAMHEGPTSPVKNCQPFVQIDDETLRDGLQGGQLEKHPSLNSKKTYLSMMANSGFINHADIAIPSNKPEQLAEASELIKFTVVNNLPITLSIAGRGGTPEDIPSIIDQFHKNGDYPLEADIFLDPGKLRAKVMGWDRHTMIDHLKNNIKLLKREGLSVMFVPERSTSTPPDELFEVTQIAADLGVDRIAIADTKGIANQKAIENIFRWSFDTVGSRYSHLKWDFHEHNDRNLEIANCLTAAREGVDREHATSHGIGERLGNPNLLSLVYNLNIEGYRQDDLSKTNEVAIVSSRLLGYNSPKTAAAYGETAYDMLSGIHTNTGVKELRQGVPTNIYFVTPPEVVGREMNVKIGPMSGKTNAEVVLCSLGFEPNPELVHELLDYAGHERRVLKDEEIKDIATLFYDKENASK